MSEFGENIVACPFDDCDARFDAVEASFVGRGPACPGCNATWKQLCAEVNPAGDPDDVEINYPIDGPGGVKA